METKIEKPTKKDFEKALYKEKPIAKKLQTATMLSSDKGEKTETEISVYKAETSIGNVVFFIPFSEQTDGDGNQKLFADQMPAQELRRWLQ